MSSPLKTIKSWLPQTLFGRSLIIVIAPVVLLQAITTYVFFDRHWSKVTQLLAEDIAGGVGACVELFVSSQDPEEQLPYLQRYAMDHFSFALNFEEGKNLPQTLVYNTRHWRESILRPSLEQKLNLPFHLLIDDQQIEIQVATLRGVLYIYAPTKQLFTRTTPIFIWWILLAPILLLIIAIAFLRNQVKPLKELSEIVDEFGKGRDVRTLRPRGAAEVRKVARAFNAMKDRIHRQITQRAEMLAGVSHDLKTPLTRMELALAMLEQTPEIVDLHEDVREMSRMINGYLAFARGEEGERPTQFDIVVLLKKLCHKMDPQHIHLISLPPILLLTARPQALQRCLTNILGNSLRYAHNAYVIVENHTRESHVIVEDDGPGVPPNAYEDIFKPFYRLESSRNQETGGSGLGLAIARTIVHSHGGRIELANSTRYGGLKVKISLPF